MHRKIAVKRRAYRSPLREQQRELTRARVVAAARALFVEQGYVATSIEEIAREAGVATRTIYTLFDSKIEILRAVRESAFSPEGPRPPGWIHPDFKAALAEPDTKRCIRRYAALIALAAERSADIGNVIAGAVGADPEVAALLAEGRANHYKQGERLSRELSRRGVLRDGITVREAADTLFAITGRDTYARLVVDRRWTRPRFEKWTDRAIRALLLRSSGA